MKSDLYKKGAKPGRKPTAFTEDQIKQIERYAEIGLTDQTIAEILEIGETTLKRAASKALSRGRAKCKRIIAESLIQMAQSKKHPAINIFLGKTRLGLREGGHAEDEKRAPTQLVFKRGPDRPSAIRKAEEAKASETPQTELKVINGT